MSNPILDDVRLLLALVDGLEGGNITCACRRVYRVGISAELGAVCKRLKEAIVGDDPEPPQNGRFSLVEVD